MTCLLYFYINFMNSKLNLLFSVFLRKLYVTDLSKSVRTQDPVDAINSLKTHELYSFVSIL